MLIQIQRSNKTPVPTVSPPKMLARMGSSGVHAVAAALRRRDPMAGKNDKEGITV